MALNYILLEDGSGHILLEDGSGSILLENQPGSTSIVFTPTGNALRGTARSSMSTSIVFTPTGTLRGSAHLGSGSTSLTFSFVSNLRAYARTTGTTSITFTVSGIATRGSARFRNAQTGILFTLLGDMCFSVRPYDPTTFPSTSPIVTNMTGLDNLPPKTASVLPPPPVKNTVGLDVLFASTQYISPNPPYKVGSGEC